ncbi:hypothetical protein LTR66_009435 [Elasticomyces elasticus]|nr:hypothetical protein LTR66_009435 [Elasticomyces elasticus]KAK4990231.1 hypothetical protein LTR50_002705 [Elasticomyces elasticus]KAK5007721.1 hypothetical protein LTR28_004925 [Elasticomyces elasticus]
MLELFQHIRHANTTLTGDLDFANDWDFFTGDPSADFESLTTTGPYAGTLEAFGTGVKLRTRYEKLLENPSARSNTSFWASDSPRVIETARYFATGFFGLDWADKSATLHVISENPDLGADTLTPGDTCAKYRDDVDDFGHELGARKLMEFRSTYLPAIADRLQEQNPNIRFSDSEIYSMQEICGFETLVRGSSPWCDVFTHDEWLSFEYARDVIHYYRAGPGNPYGATMGWLWLNATTTLLNEGPSAGPFFLSFAHDGDILPLLAALDLFPDPPLPTNRTLPNRLWRASQLVPMGGRLIIERLTRPATRYCWNNAPLYPNHVYCEPERDDVFIRININDGIVAVPGCDHGPGRSCPLDQWTEWVEARGRELGAFKDVCGLADDAPDRITFLHQ